MEWAEFTLCYNFLIHLFMEITSSVKILYEGVKIMESDNLSKVESKIYQVMSILMVFVGVFLRLYKYFLGRSFRGDEATLAIGVINRSLSDLLVRPMDYGVVAPIGFLAVEKFLSQFLGSHDFIFRLIPLAAGCASVVLIYFLSRKIMGAHGALFAIAGLCLNSSLIIYSSDFKQYSSDVLVSIILYMVTVNYLKNVSRQNMYILGAAGFGAILVSQPAIFIVASISITLLLYHRKDKPKFIWAFVVSSLWAGLFVFLYFLSFRHFEGNSYLVKYWDDLNALMPMPPWEDLSWYPVRISGLFTSLLDLPPFPLIEIAVFLLGLTSFYLRNRWEYIIAFTAPVFFTMLASGVINYPFKGRLIFFLAPGLLIVLGEGLERIFQFTGKAKWLSQAVWLVLFVFLLSTPFQSVNALLTSPRYYPFREDIKPVLEYMQKNGRPDDLIFLYHEATAPFNFYAPLYGISLKNVIYSENLSKQPQKYSGYIDNFPKNQRVWFVFSYVINTKTGMDEREYILRQLEMSGWRLLEKYNVDDVSFGYLYIME